MARTTADDSAPDSAKPPRETTSRNRWFDFFGGDWWDESWDDDADGKPKDCEPPESRSYVTVPAAEWGLTFGNSETTHGLRFTSHPQATIGSDCRLGDGTILNAGARATTDITLGRHVQLHANCTVGHDATLDDFVSVYPGATSAGRCALRS